VDSSDLTLTADVPWWDPVDPDVWRLGSEFLFGGAVGAWGGGREGGVWRA
jgi:hypothetical protein